MSHRHFYTQTPLHTQRPLYIDFNHTHTHTHAFTDNRFYTHLLRTVIANSVVECIWRAKTIQLHLTGTEGVWCGLKGKFFRRHLEEWNKINRSQEELRNIHRKSEWTRDSPQSQIAPTVQKDTWEVTFIRSCAEFKNPDVILVEKRHGGFWVGHTTSRFKNCRYVCTATWMGLRWPMPSKCPWAPCET